jgi:gentisate 1,2-dioxygenase
MKWREIYDSLLQAREKISVASGSVERRVIRLVNPGMPEHAKSSFGVTRVMITI